ncbi:MAG TPA: NAD(P)-dependent oxidoreductase [Burkholderiaceae bacterium]|nr:NAD(P)-dependent oxidoreductase [Burkholderiaceae bacterium]
MTAPLRFLSPIAQRLRAGNERILVTGATGWLGRALLEMLGEAFGPALGARVRCFGSVPKMVRLRDGSSVAQHALADLETLPAQPSILFHFAYLTKEKTAAMTAAEYVERNRSISALTERAAAKVGADRVFLASSGAAAQALAAGAGVDSVHAYGALKLEDEALFRRYAESGAHRRVLAVRLFNLSGPYINKLGSYALSSFIEQARSNGVIEIKAAHRVVRSYTAVENLLATAMAHLLDEGAGRWSCIDTAGEREVEVGELAQRVRALVGPQVDIRRPDVATDRVDRYVGDGSAYRSMAARLGVAQHPLDRQIEDTRDYLVQVT